MVPEGIGLLKLFIDEGVGRVPARDQRAPGKGQTKEAEAIVDLRPFGDGDGERTSDAEAQFWRGNSFEVVGRSEKGEDFLAR